MKMFRILNLLYVLCVVTFCMSVGCSSDTTSENAVNEPKKPLLDGKYSVNLKVKTANISGNPEDTGMSEVSNIKMWMEFSDDGRLINTTLADGQKTPVPGTWSIEKDSLFFKTDRGLKYAYKITKGNDGKILLKNEDYELSLISEE